MLGSEHTRGLAALDRCSGACAAAVWFAHGNCIGELQRVPLEVNRRVGKGALCAPCPPLATDRVGTARAIKLACHSSDWSARAFAHPTNVIQFHRDLLQQKNWLAMPNELKPSVRVTLS